MTRRWLRRREEARCHHPRTELWARRWDVRAEKVETTLGKQAGGGRPKGREGRAEARGLGPAGKAGPSQQGFSVADG